jgi:hypothetical protein
MMPAGSRRAGARDDDRLDRLAPFLVGDADHGDVGDIGMTGDRVLDLGGIDVLAAGHDHVLHAVVDVDIAVVIAVRGVAGAHPAVVNRGGGRLRLVPITLHDDRRFDDDFPDRAGRNLGAVRVDDLDRDAGPRDSA